MELSLASSIWVRPGEPLSEAFLERSRSAYGAHVESLDLGAPETKAIMSRWLDAFTRGKISGLIPPNLDPRTTMVLLNAVYFRGRWRKPFDLRLTYDAPFYRADGSETSVPMMSPGAVRLPFYQAEEVQVLGLPYKSSRFSMIVVLPDPEVRLVDLLAGLEAGEWARWAGRLRERQGHVSIPRFKVECVRSLAGPLRALGMGIAFDLGRADSSGMSQRGRSGFLIDHLVHKAYLQADEEGTEAAAVTMMLEALDTEDERFTFSADRPFLYAIHDGDTGAILFLGVMMDPGA